LPRGAVRVVLEDHLPDSGELVSVAEPVGARRRIRRAADPARLQDGRLRSGERPLAHVTRPRRATGQPEDATKGRAEMEPRTQGMLFAAALCLSAAGASSVNAGEPAQPGDATRQRRAAPIE